MKKEIRKKCWKVIAGVYTLMLIAFISLSTSCTKHELVDPNISDNWEIKCQNTTIADNIINLQPGIMTVMWIEYVGSGSGQISSATWDFGDGSAVVSGVIVNHIWLSAGTYTMTVVYTPVGGNQTTKTITVIIGTPGTNNKCLALYSSSPTTNNKYNYYLVGWSGVIYNYQNIPTNPWCVGSTLGWSPVTITSTIQINNQTWLPFPVIERENGEEIVQFGRGNNWSFGNGYDYWLSDGTTYGGTYHLMCQNGQIVNGGLPGDPPGVSGDPTNGTDPPTIRYDIQSNLNPTLSDSLIIYFNNQFYGGGNLDPFVEIKYSPASAWVPVHQVIFSNDWGYLKVAVDYIVASGGVLYYRFGSNFSNLANLADMSHSISYLSSLSCCGVQAAGPMNGNHVESFGLALGAAVKAE